MGVTDVGPTIERERSHALLGDFHVQEVAPCIHHCSVAKMELGADSVDLIQQLFNDNLLRFGQTLLSSITQQERAHQ